jgi:type II secretory pathway pseudopilin PulG
MALVAILSAVVLAGCSSGSSSQTAAPAAQTQQQTTQPTQQQTTTSGQQPTTTSGQQPSGQGQESMKKVVARAATILGVSETDLTTAFDAAMKANRPSGSDNKTPPSGQPPSGQTTSGQSGQGQPPSGSSDMMTSVYSKIATALNLSADKVKAAFEQAQSELKQ